MAEDGSGELGLGRARVRHERECSDILGVFLFPFKTALQEAS